MDVDCRGAGAHRRNTLQPIKNMKIRLETTNSEPQYSHAVEIAVHHDNLNIHQLWEDIIVPALLGFGFQQSSIDEINQP